MYISTNDWKNYIQKLSALDEKAAQEMRKWIQSNGFSDTEALIDYAYAVATKYGEGSAALSAAMYDAVAEMSGKFYEAAEVAPTPKRSEVAKAINGVTKWSKNPDSVANAVGRLVKQTGADTTLRNAERDGAQFAWIPSGDTCAFCIALASRGWQPMSAKAWKKGHAEHIHANCDCTYAVRFDNKSGVKGYDPQEYADMYYGAEGDNPQDKINSIRRMKYQENKDRINAQKRAAYAERRQLEMNYKPVLRDTENQEVFKAREGSISISPVIDSRNNLYISDSVTVKPKELHRIEQQVDFAKKATGMEEGNLPRFVVVSDTDLGSMTGGRFDAESNTVLFKIMTDKDKQQFVIVHETFHGKDYRDFIERGDTFTNQTEYIERISRDSKKILDKRGITRYNVDEISDYAKIMYELGRFDETYTDYRTVQALKRK